MTALEPVGGLLQPLTGELVRADDVAGLAEALEQLREHKRVVDAVIAEFTEAALEQSRVHGTKTLHAGGFTLKMSADTETEYDPEVLDGLLAAGLPHDRFAALVTTTITRKVNAAVAKQLEAANPKYARIIQRARSVVPKRQYVTASRG